MKKKTKKLTTYQKLKAENLALKQDIHDLVRGEFLPKLQTESKWRIVFDAEDAVMAGTHGTIKEGNGIWSQIKSKSTK